MANESKSIVNSINNHVIVCVFVRRLVMGDVHKNKPVSEWNMRGILMQ